MAHLLPLADAVWACETPASMSRRGMKAVAEGLADALLDENLTDFDDLVVAGYSLGGVFAHEVAQALTARVGQMRVTGLLIDVPPADAPVPSLGDTLDSFVRVGWRIDTPEPQAFVDSAGNRDFVAIAAAAAAAGTLPKNAGACEVEEAWQVYEANTKIMDGYAPTPRPGDRRALLRGAQAGGALHSSSDLGWAACELDSTWAGILAPDRCWAVEVDHLALLEPPNDATVARWLIWVADCWPRTERTLID
jgi:thioesterase domain-containing protein